MKLIKILVIVFICYVNDLKGQDVNFCKIYQSIYNKDLQQRYRFAFVADTLVLLKPVTSDKFVKDFKQFIPRKKLKRIFGQDKTAFTNFQQSNCFADSLIVTKQQRYEVLRSIDPWVFIKDSSFVKSVDQQHYEIVKVEDEEQRNNQLNTLTQTTEFKKYSEAMDYFTPCIFEYSYPVFYKDLIFVQVNLLGRHSDMLYGRMYLLKKSGSEWDIISNKRFTY